MKRKAAGWRLWLPAMVTALVLSSTVPPFAQEQEQEGGCCGKKSGAMDKDHMAQMQKMHEQMEAMHQEMGKKLHEQLAALREHAKKMDEVTDEKALLPELKKHQAMTDDLLGMMVEFHEKMHEHIKEPHEHMRQHMQKGATEGKKEEEAPETQPQE